jgi:hypothetical protein
MNGRRVMALALLLACAGCATGGDGEEPDAAPPDGTLLDRTNADAPSFDSMPPPDSPSPRDAGPDVTTFDVVAPFDVLEPTDVVVPPADAAKDAGADALDCLSAGAPCNYDLDNCPPFWECELAIVEGGVVDAGPSDAGPNADAGPDAPEMVEGGLGGSNNGVCLFVFDIATAPPCPCASGQRCLMASQICLTAAEVVCVCDNPKTAEACAPP